MIDIVGVGASSVDLVYVLPAYPAPEGPLSKLPIESHFISVGGQMATAMAGCAALGLRTAFLGTTGNDEHGARIRAELTRRGVDVSHARIAEGPQPYAVILLADGGASEAAPAPGLPAEARSAQAGERIVLWHRDASAKLDPMEFSRASRGIIEQARLLHIDDVDVDVAIAAATIARDAGRMITTDVDRVTGRTKELIQLVTHPILAEHVPYKLTGERDLLRALRLLRPLNAGPLTVTRGAHGALALDGDAIIDAPGFHVDAVDTTGAGDVFRAGFMTALLEGRRLQDTLRFANAAAALSCTRRGAVASVPSRDEVEQMLRSS